jgi:hypothetical protein
MERKAKTPVKAQRSIGVDFSLYTAVEMMAKSGPTCPSLAVVDRQNNVVGVLTTSMIIQQLHTNSKALKQLLDMPVGYITLSSVNRRLSVLPFCRLIHARPYQ